jgi:hypothetical protein
MDFWMARASWLQGLIPYAEFAANPGHGRLPGDRHLAEMAVNRMGRMRSHAIDGTSLTNKTSDSHTASLLGTGKTFPGNVGAGFIAAAVIEASGVPVR